MEKEEVSGLQKLLVTFGTSVTGDIFIRSIDALKRVLKLDLSKEKKGGGG